MRLKVRMEETPSRMRRDLFSSRPLLFFGQRGSAIPQAGNFRDDLPRRDEMGGIADLSQIREEKDLGFADPAGSAEHLFDQPGTGRAPHSLDPQNQRERVPRARDGRNFRGRGRGFRIGGGAGDDSAFQAGAIESGFAKVSGGSFRTGGKNLINSPAAEAAEAKRFPAGFQMDCCPADGKTAEIARGPD